MEGAGDLAVHLNGDVLRHSKEAVCVCVCVCVWDGEETLEGVGHPVVCTFLAAKKLVACGRCLLDIHCTLWVCAVRDLSEFFPPFWSE